MESIGHFDVSDTVLGEGGYGQVRKAIDNSKTPPDECAAKLIDSTKMRVEAISREVEVNQRVNGHAGIVTVRGYEQVGRTCYIFMDLASGGELFDQVIDSGKLSEPRARKYFTELCEAVLWCHAKGVAHRDLKLENVLLTTTGQVKVIDFGLAHVYPVDGATGAVDRSARLYETCGSKSYAAPEVMTGVGYDGYLADSWSCAICLFAMLAGFFPLDEATNKDWRYTKLVESQQAGQSSTHTIFGFYGMPCPLSESAIAMLDGMLAIDPAKRLSLEGAMAAVWMTPAPTPKSSISSAAPPMMPSGQSFSADGGEFIDDEPRYRSAMLPTMEELENQTSSMFMDDDEPIYRSLGAGPVASVPSPPKDAPTLGRQKAFAVRGITTDDC